MTAITDQIVVFCDDNSESPFWMSGALSRPGWSNDAWPEWRIHRVSSPGSRGTWVARFVAAINEATGGSEIYVVTDAQFGSDPEGGAQLLQLLLDSKKLKRGVVFSVAPEIGNLRLEPRVLAAVDNRTMDGQTADSIRLFLKSGIRDNALSGRDDFAALSAAIHQLENLALPLVLDIESLTSSGADLANVAEVFLDYFNCSEPIGYLASGKRFPVREKPLEGEVAGILDTVATIQAVVTSGCIEPYLHQGVVSSNAICSEWNLDVFRKQSTEATAESREWLTSTLNNIASKIRGLANGLREIRNAPQAQNRVRT